MRIFFLISWLAIPVFVCAQDSAPQPSPSPSGLKTYTAPDSAFRFTYPDLLIKCEKRKQGEGYIWAQKECSAYFPTCDKGVGLDQTRVTIACVAYPRDKHTDTGTFEAATFSVGEVNPAGDRQSCVSPALDQIDRKRVAVTIHGVRFSHFESGEGAMNQGVGADVYRTFHGGKCYELTIALATANAGVFDPPERELTRKDVEYSQSPLGAGPRLFPISQITTTSLQRETVLLAI